MDIALIVLLTLLNGVFAMSEMALSSSRKARLAAMDEAGDKGAQQALRLMGAPTRFLSTVQIGITSIGVLNGIVGEAAFSDGVAQSLAGWGMGAKAAGITATAIVVAVITFTTIIFGELVPKRIGQLYPEAVARQISRPMAWLARAAAPLVWLLSASTNAVLRALRVNANAGRAVTEDEIRASLEEGVDAGVIEANEHQMVRNVFHLDDRPLTSLMVPRSDIVWAEADESVRATVERVGASGHSWFPVCRGGLDDIAGIASVHQLLNAKDGASRVGDLAQAVGFVPETLTGMELLEQFRAQAARMVFVVDEYGGVQGLLTTRDLLEAITGELKPRAAADAWATHLPDGSWALDGAMPVTELQQRLELDALPEQERGRYTTVAGLVLLLAGRLPEVGDAVSWEGWVFTVDVVVQRRVEAVRARRGEV